MNQIVQRRLRNQQLGEKDFQTPAEVVGWLGAVQAQEYDSAKWALALRLNGVTGAQIDQAFDEGTILRTHVLRPTWHFVLPADLRWLQRLTGLRVKASLASYDRRLELDADVLSRAYRAFEQALGAGQPMTRTELAGVLAQVGIVASGQRLSHLVMHAEQDGVLCSGPRRGSQFTYLLFDQRVPPAPNLAREDAITRLAQRYFTSHGPAQLKDFAWWSGLTQADGRLGLANLHDALQQEQINGKTYYFSATLPPAPLTGMPNVFLLPNYDEIGIAYADREAMLDPSRAEEWLFSFVNGYLLVDGWVSGLWKRTLAKRNVTIAIQSFRPFSESEQTALEQAAQQYANFLGLPFALEWLA